ncbi:unnamed protein product [Rangifer tarandus platyrhynchus]|uniref:Uncharacterized protein n=2 Tax=Rangifer tarandus platyrhynchus TaxID=3082113 RepID=A0AC59YFI5_RANTA|nr:unnamed protein product [Rangifer tarandus platyrhynchus]
MSRLQEKAAAATDFISLGSKITADSDHGHEVKRRLLPGSKAITNLDSVLKKQRWDFADKPIQSKLFFSGPPRGFPNSSVGKEFACHVGDLGSIAGLGRSLGEGKGYPLQYSGLENSMDYICSMGSQRVTTEQLSLSGDTVVKNPPANTGSIPGSGRPLEKEMTTHSSLFAWKIPWTEKPGVLQFTGSKKIRLDLVTKPPIHDFFSSHA